MITPDIPTFRNINKIAIHNDHRLQPWSCGHYAMLTSLHIICGILKPHEIPESIIKSEHMHDFQNLLLKWPLLVITRNWRNAYCLNTSIVVFKPIALNIDKLAGPESSSSMCKASTTNKPIYGNTTSYTLCWHAVPHPFINNWACISRNVIYWIFFLGELRGLDVINNHQTELFENGEDYLYSNDTSFIVDDNDDYHGNVDYDPRYERNMSHSKLNEGLSEPNYRKRLNNLKQNSDWKSERDERNVAMSSSQNMSESDDTSASKNVPFSSTSSESKNLSKNRIP